MINQAPTATINLPLTNSTSFSDQIIQFYGQGFDKDEQISDSYFKWSSNIDGNLGTGRQITASLSQGDHTITLVVTDEMGLVGQDSVTVTVQAGARRPSAVILQPEHGRFYGDREIITFEGQGLDPEDGVLSGSSLSWFSSKDGFLGNGNVFERVLSGPPPEPCESRVTHEITLVVTDSDGNEGRQSFEIKVGRIC